MIKLRKHGHDGYHMFELFTERLQPVLRDGIWQDFEHKPRAHVEFKWGNKHNMLSSALEFSPDGERGSEVTFSLCLPYLFTLFVSVQCSWFRKLDEAVRLGFRVCHEDHWIKFDTFSLSNSWNSSDPWWKKGIVFHYADFFLGKRVYTRKVVRTFETPVTVPRGSFVSHDCIFWTNLCVDTWKRRFWPAYKLVRYDTTFVPPVPFDGKYGPDHHHSECGPLLWASVPRTLNDKNYQAMMMGHVKQKILKDMKRDR